MPKGYFIKKRGTKMKTWKKILALLLTLAMALSMAACGSGKDPGSGSSAGTDAANTGTDLEASDGSEPTTIYFCNYMVLETAHTDYWNRLIADFEKEHPEYRVEVVSAAYNDVLTYVTTRVGGGEKVDCMIGEVEWNQVLASNGITSPVSTVLDADLLAQFDPDVLDCYNYDGECYGLPLYLSNLIVYANKNYLEQAGLDYANPPRTDKELLEWCEKLQGVKDASGEQVTAFGISMAEKTAPGSFLKSLIYAFGGQILDENGKLSLDNQGFEEALAFIKECTDKGYSPVNSLPKDFRPGMASGKVAMYVDQTWGFSGVYSVDPNATDYVASFPIPNMGTSGTGATSLSATTLYVNDNGGKEAEGTREFVKFIMDYDETWQHAYETTPAYYCYEGAADKELSPVLAGAKDSAFNLKVETYLPEQDAFQIAIATMINSICMGEAAQQEAVEKFTNTVTPLLP